MDVSIIIPVKNGGRLLKRVLDAIACQDSPLRWETLVIDSGSSDGTLAMLRNRPHIRLYQIPAREFSHSQTRNLGVRLAKGRWIIMLTQDALPTGPRWLSALVAPLEQDEQAHAAYSRVLPHPGDPPHVAFRVQEDIAHGARSRCQTAPPHGASPERVRLAANLHDISSAYRGAYVRNHPFPLCRFGEDILMGLQILTGGGKIVFAPDSMVYHSHRYSLRALYKRARIDGYTNKRYFNRHNVGNRPLTAMRNLKGRTAVFAAALRHKHITAGTLLRLIAEEAALVLGQYRGGRTAYHPPAFREPPTGRPVLLFVLHGFPPHTRAGTELFTLQLAEHFKQRFRVVVLCRAGDPEAPQYTLKKESFQGITVYRIVNNQAYNCLQETYSNPHIEALFNDIVRREKPDIIHFNHTLHLSTTLLGRTADMGIPFLATLHDYFYLCPKIKYVLFPGRLCRYKRPGVACALCIRQHWRLTGLLARLDACSGSLLSRIVSRVGKARLVRWLPENLAKDMVDMAGRLDVTTAQLAKSRVITCPSPMVQDVVSPFIRDTGKVLYINNCVDGRLFKETHHSNARDGRATWFGFAGSLIPEKGIHLLLAAFRALKVPSARLLVYGLPGPDRDFQGQLERQMAQDERISFKGAYSHNHIADVLARMDVLIIPSLWRENSPLILHEALRAGIRVLVPRPSAMTAFVGGHFFRFNNRRDLTRQMHRLAAGRDNPAPVGTAKDCSILLHQFHSVYQQLLCLRQEPALRRCSGGAFSDIQGHYEMQGQYLLLRNTPAQVAYALDVPAQGSYRLTVVLQLFARETTVPIGGTLRVAGSGHPFGPFAVLKGQGDHSQPVTVTVQLPPGTCRLRLSNQAGDAVYFLRIKELRLEKDMPCMSPSSSSI